MTLVKTLCPSIVTVLRYWDLGLQYINSEKDTVQPQTRAIGDRAVNKADNMGGPACRVPSTVSGTLMCIAFNAVRSP